LPLGHKVKIFLPTDLAAGRVELDDTPIWCVRSLHVDAAVNESASLTLDLVLHEQIIDGEMVVKVLDETRTTLLALGWTPPAD
jgi:hypothetical protein